MYGQQVYDQSMMQQPIYGQPGYGQPMYGQPVYGQPMMPVQPVIQPVYMQPQPVQTGPTIITIDGGRNDGMYCQFCQQQTGQIIRKTIGCVAISWAIFYLCMTGIFCFIPCLSDRYKDTQFVCVKCQQVKQTVPAECC